MDQRWGGQLSAKQSVDAAFSGVSAIHVADVNGDGHNDVIGAGGEVAWWQNNGSGNFAAKETLDINFTTPLATHAADLDADGDLDILGGSKDMGVAWWENPSGGVTTYTLSGQILDPDNNPTPDLTITTLTASANSVQFVIENQGDVPVQPSDEFWVDLYINPNPAPAAVNQTWEDLASEGMTWGVTADLLPLLPGEVVILTCGDAHYWPEASNFPGAFPAGAQLYAQVDSANADTAYGAVQERDELGGGTYNNIIGPVSPGVRQATNEASRPAPLTLELIRTDQKDHLPQRR